MVVDEILAAPGDACLPAPDGPGLGCAGVDVETVAGARLGHLSLQQPLVGRVQPGHQTLRLLLEVFCKAPVRLPGEGSCVWVSVSNAFLDGLLDESDVLLQGVGWPRVEHDVQELADVTSDFLRLAGGLLTNDRDEPANRFS